MTYSTYKPPTNHTIILTSSFPNIYPAILPLSEDGSDPRGRLSLRLLIRASPGQVWTHLLNRLKCSPTTSNRLGGNRSILSIIGLGARTATRLALTGRLLSFRLTCPRATLGCPHSPLRWPILPWVGTWQKWWVRYASWNWALLPLPPLRPSSNPRPSQSSHQTQSPANAQLLSSNRTHWHLFDALWSSVEIFCSSLFSYRRSVGCHPMNLHDKRSTRGKHVRLFRWEDNVLDWTFVVEVFCCFWPLCVISIVWQHGNPSCVISCH